MTIGIDFGTTNSCICYFNKESNQPSVIVNENGNYTTPTVIYFDSYSDTILIGETAMEHDTGVIQNFKRLVGVLYNDFKCNNQLINFFDQKKMCIVKDPSSDYCAVKIQYNNKECVMSIPELIQKFIEILLFDIKNRIANSDNYDLKSVVITVPAYFNNEQRNIIKQSCENLQLNVLRIINEPTAAILANSINKQSNLKNCSEEYVLVLDCGGGTIDISLVSIDYSENIYEVIKTIGDNFLGGEDITLNLENYIIKTLITNTQNKIKHLNYIKKQAEKIKKELSYKQVSTFYYECNDIVVPITISRPEFDIINKEFFKNIENLISEIVLGYCSNIKNVVFVGGTSRIPYLEKICKKIIGNHIVINNKLDPDTSIATGACIQAHNLTTQLNDNIITLIDILPFSIGIEIEGGFMNTIISKNTPLPTSKTQIFSNSDDNINFIDINIYQGERKFVIDNVYLGTIHLKNLDDTLKRGEMKINVKFNIDENGIVSVCVIDNKTKTVENITLKSCEVKNTCDVNDNDNCNYESDTNSDDIFTDCLKTQIVIKKLEIEKLLRNAKNIINGQNFIRNLTYKKLNVLLIIVTKFLKVEDEGNFGILKKIQTILDKFKNELHELIVKLQLIN